MEAALRTAVEKLTGEELKALDFSEVRGTAALKKQPTMSPVWMLTLQLHLVSQTRELFWRTLRLAGKIITSSKSWLVRVVVSMVAAAGSARECPQLCGFESGARQGDL